MMIITETRATLTEIQRIKGVGINAVYVVRRAGKKVANIRRTGRLRWLLYSVHYGENLNTYANLESARYCAVARTSYPDAEEVYETICARVEQQRRAWMRQQRANDFADTALDLATDRTALADRIILISRSIESFAKDRLDTGERERQRMESHPGEFRHGVPLYPSPPGERK
jgi:hypothetical protein